MNIMGHRRRIIHAESLALRHLYAAHQHIPTVAPPDWGEDIVSTVDAERRERERTKKARYRARKKANPAA